MKLKKLFAVLAASAMITGLMAIPTSAASYNYWVQCGASGSVLTSQEGENVNISFDFTVSGGKFNNGSDFKLRITTDGASQALPFTIVNIKLTSGSTVIFDDISKLDGIKEGSVIENFSPAFGGGGAPKATYVKNKGLVVENRSRQWHGIDLYTTELADGNYKIEYTLFSGVVVADADEEDEDEDEDDADEADEADEVVLVEETPAATVPATRPAPRPAVAETVAEIEAVSATIEVSDAAQTDTSASAKTGNTAVVAIVSVMALAGAAAVVTRKRK